MPFPALLVWGAAAAVGAFGVKKGYDAYSDFGEAKEIGESAERKFNRAKDSLERDRKKTENSLIDLGKLKASVFTTQIKYMVDICSKFRSKIEGYDQKVFLENLPEMERMVEQSLELEKGIGTAAASSALLGMGTYGLVGTFGVASTGTAIGSLSGVAATNATLAWLGGGSLAAGGFGMAGGMVALGGIVAAPALAIGGFIMASKAEKAKTEAERYAAKVDVEVEKVSALRGGLDAIRQAAAEQTAVINETVERFERVKVNNMDDPKAFYRMVNVGKALKQMLEIPVMNKDGKANKNIRIECEGCLKLGMA